MKTFRTLVKGALGAVLVLMVCCAAPAVQAQGTAFTYQGRLNDGANPANGSYDFQFNMWSAASGPAQVGSTRARTATPVSNGVFTVMLDFGNQFPGAARWLEMAVRTNGGSSFSTLGPRQAITATPYAVQAASALTAATASSVAAANITGALAEAQLPANLARTDQPNVFTMNQSIVGNLRVNDKDILLSTGNDNAFGLGFTPVHTGKPLPVPVQTAQCCTAMREEGSALPTRLRVCSNWR